MYTKMPTDIALNKICWYIRAHAHDVPDTPVEALCSALRILMKCNIFPFGDTFWRQLSGTSMVSPSAPPWANIFYALCELIFLETFQENIVFYRRFIDDIFGIWRTVNPITNDATWASFQLAVNN
jgi:hypothetical protein